MFSKLTVHIELSAEKVNIEMAAVAASSWERTTQSHRVAKGISCRSLWTSMLGVSYCPFQERYVLQVYKLVRNLCLQS